MVTSDFRSEVEICATCMRNTSGGSGHNNRNSSFIADVAMGQIPRITSIKTVSRSQIFNYARCER